MQDGEGVQRCGDFLDGDVASGKQSRFFRRESRPESVMEKSEVVHRICDVVAAEAEKAFGSRMVSLVLTGSTARDEVTAVSGGDKWRLLSDAEFLAVIRVESRTDIETATAVREESVKKLRSAGIEVALDMAVVTRSYFQNLPPHIFSYELRSCGKVISGDPAVLNLIPSFTAQEISKEDAWRLLCNRMIEQFAFLDDLESSTVELTPRLEYATVKLYLDMATSYLVFAGQYAPTYRERADRLLKLASQPGGNAPFPLMKFASQVAECTTWKLSGEDEISFGGVEFWHEAISYMRRLWRWEMIQMTHASGELTVASLSKRLAEQLTAKQRLRAWLSLAKRDGWLKSCPKWPRWMRLASRSTPRYLVYQVATEIAFRLPCLVKHNGAPPRLDLNWSELRSLLPENAPRPSSGSNAVWRCIVSDVLWNYSHFLRSTRA